MRIATYDDRPNTQVVFAVLLIALFVASPATCSDTKVTWSVDRGWLTAEADGLQLLDASDGPVADVTIGDEPFIGGRKIPAKVKKTAGGGFEVTRKTGTGKLIDRYEPFAAMGENAWLRTLTYVNRSDKTQDLCGATMRVLPAVLPKANPWNPRDFWMGRVAGERSVCVSFRGTTDSYRLGVDRKHRVFHHVDVGWRLKPGKQATVGSQGIWLAKGGEEVFRQEARRWFEAIDLHVPEDTPEWVSDMILYEVCAGGHIDSRFSDVGGFDRLRHQVDYLADLGVTAVWLQAPHRHKTPPNPVKGGWNHYDPLDFSQIDPILGGAEALKRLTDAFESRGIRVLGELVPHGGHSMQGRALKEWWTCNRDGAAKRNWGGCGMDYSSPQWQTVMKNAAARLAKEFGMVGARIDVADGSGPNWRSPKTAHASYSTLGGALEMLRAIREGMAEGTPHPVLIPESWNTIEFFRASPIGYGHGGWFLYGRDIPPRVDRPVEMVELLRDFYETQRGAYPPRARILRTLNNHDTVSHYGRAHFRYGVGLSNALYGVCLTVPGIPMMYQEEELGCYEARRRLNWARRRVPEFADGDVSYSAVTFAPEAFSCLRYTEKRSAVGLSNLSGKRIVGTVKLQRLDGIADGMTVYDAVSGETAVVHDGRFPWTLGPYETALIRIGEPPIGEIPAERFHGEAVSVECEPTPFDLKADENAVCFRSGRLIAKIHAGDGPWSREKKGDGVVRLTAPYGSVEITPRERAYDVEIHLSQDGPEHTPEIVVHNADRWRVSGRTALLSDRVLRRHFRFPPGANYVWTRTMGCGTGPHGRHYNRVAPVGRLWESIIEPLHGERPAWEVRDRDGAAIVFSRITANVENMVLTDRTDEAQCEPYGLAFRFYKVDADLSPKLAVAGRGPWTMDSYPRDASGPVAVRFRVSNGSEPDAFADAPRHPISRDTAKLTKSKGQIRESDGIVWLVEPGTLSWSGLEPPTGERRRIRFELRHSESAPEGTDLQEAYEVRVDGRVVPLEWVKHNTWHTGNAYFGHAVTPPLDLSTRARAIQIRTSKPWCAVRGGFHVVNGGGD